MKRDILGESRADLVDTTTLNSGSLVFFRSIPYDTTKQDIKIALLHVCVTSYVDYVQKANEAIVRFPSAVDADKFLAKCQEKPFKIKECTIQMAKLVHDQECEYFDKVRIKRERFNKEKADLKKKTIQKAIIEQKKKTHIKHDVKNRAAVMSNKKTLAH
jgi:RNA binding motif